MSASHDRGLTVSIVSISQQCASKTKKNRLLDVAQHLHNIFFCNYRHFRQAKMTLILILKVNNYAVRKCVKSVVIWPNEKYICINKYDYFNTLNYLLLVFRYNPYNYGYSRTITFEKAILSESIWKRQHANSLALKNLLSEPLLVLPNSLHYVSQ